MIGRDEIDAKAAEFKVHQADIQRDYVFGWLLCGLFTVSTLKDRLFLKGGNALRKAYFGNTRYSADLDLGIPDDITAESLRSELDTVCAWVQEQAGVAFVVPDTRVEEKFTATDVPIPGLRVFETRVYFRNFYGNAGHIRIKVVMDLTRFDRVLLPLQRRELIHPFSDAAAVACTITCMKLEEIIASKMKCLLQRQHAPDLFDYAFTIQQLGGELNKEEVVQTLVRKTIFERNPHVLKQTLKTISLDYARETWERGITCAKNIAMRVEDAINVFVSGLDGLFQIYPDTGSGSFAFIAAEWRVPIMIAGRQQTLIKMRYRGAERVVEPYSLKYMVRRDGIQREYFFGYNREGGSSPPGMRSFVSEGIEAVVVTDEPFTPQHPVELAKAGDFPEDRYLFDPNKPRRKPRSTIGRSRLSAGLGKVSEPRYVYRCPMCGKKSVKSTNDSRLRPHKAKGGYPCSGRYGIYVTTMY